MCTVQLLYVADMTLPLEDGLAARPTPRSVRRRLFADDSETARVPVRPFLDSSVYDLHRREKEKWNFDFVEERPLPGRYQWVQVCSGSPRVANTDMTISGKESVNGSRSFNSRSVKTSTKRSKISSATKRSKISSAQTKITDYLHIRKRQRTSNDWTSHKLKSRNLEIRQSVANISTSTACS